MVTINTQENATEITLTPNRSANWSQIKLWLCLLSLPAIIVGMGWFVAGVWIILPFVGLELALLCVLMYRVCYQNYRREQIRIDRDNVTFTAGISKTDKEYIFTRPDCYLNVHKPTSPMDNLQLFLRNDSHSFAIGEFLNNEEKESARRSICRAGLIECNEQWWSRSS